MRPDFSIIDGPYLRDLLAQPESLSATWNNLEVSPSLGSIARRLGKGEFRQILLTGMGSSFHVLWPLHLDLLRHGLPSLMVETSELVHYLKELISPQTLIVAVSQSGQSAEIIHLIKLNRGRATLIAVTNTAGSPLATRAHATVMTFAGPEFSVSCKTYLTALLALEWLSGVLCGRDLHRARLQLKTASSAVAGYLAHWKNHVTLLMKRLRQANHLFLVGRGESQAAAGVGALIIKEATHVHAEGMSSAAFRHGPLEFATGEVFVLVFAGAPPTRALNHRLCQDILKRGGQSCLVTELAPFRLPKGPPLILPILEFLIPEMMTLALAARDGREPGRFARATKITTTE